MSTPDSETKPPEDGGCPDDLPSDLNQAALQELQRLVAASETLLPRWRDELLRMLADGLAADPTALIRMAEDPSPDTTEEAQC